MHPALKRLSPAHRAKIKPAPMPTRPHPMKAKLYHHPFSHENWVFERKLDGERCIAFGTSEGTYLRSRNNLDLNAVYPEIRDALNARRSFEFLADGEIVAFSGNITRFQRLQERMKIHDENEARKSGVAVYFYLFDLTHLAGYDVSQLPLYKRKSLLKQLFTYNNRVRYTPHRNQRGEAYLQEACRKGWEGLIAKKRDSVYSHRRSANWRKLKCVHRQEFLIIGYTEPRGSRTGFGALLIGYYEGNKIRYAGKVGTGFTEDTLNSLSEMLARQRRAAPPPMKNLPDDNTANWVAPIYVAEVGFTEWTRDGRLRHPRFLGLRRDKSPREVRREEGGPRENRRS